MLAYYYEQLRIKREQIEKLNTCRSLLQGKQGEFNDGEEKCLQPELTITTWHGDHASDFQDIREEGIHTPYLEISGKQFEAAFKVIAEKIASLKLEIIIIEGIIAALLAAEKLKLV